MSTLKATNLQHASAASPNIVLDANGNATMAGTMAMATPFGMRNRVINGAMEIDQRNAGAAVTTNGAFPVDRFVLGFDTGSQSAQQSTTAPNNFKNSIALTISTGASPSASQQNNLRQFIEGQNIVDLGFGSSAAKTITLSFWVRSSVTGTYSCAFMNNAYDRSYVATYTVSAANTWEYKTITLAGDTAGTWLTTNGVGLRVYWDTGCGSNYNTTAGAWTAGTYFRTSGSVNLCATTGATFYLTGVQLEVGSVATPFERRFYGQELVLCQRYYEKSTVVYYYQLPTNSGAQVQRQTNKFLVEKRSSPTGTVTKTGGSAGTSVGTDGLYVDGFLASFGGSAGEIITYSWAVTAEL